MLDTLNSLSPKLPDLSRLSVTQLANIHQLYQLDVKNNHSPLSILQFSAEEELSQPYRYTIEFTSTELDIQPEAMLNSRATFKFFAPFDRDKIGFKKLTEPESLADLMNTPLRSVHGVITDFARLSTSRDESRYRAVLQPQLALLGNQRKHAIYQDKTVHQVVEAVLREHDFHGAYFWNQSVQTYPNREFFCQWNESDLAFIQRICAEVGVWFRFEMDAKLNREVIIFADDSSKLVHGVKLPHVHPSNLNDNKTESVWQLSTIHKVVEASVTTKDYNYRDPNNPLLNTETVRTVIDMNELNPPPAPPEITYGNAYHYNDDFLTEGTGFQPDPESGKFFAKLRHERYLNGQTRITGMSTSHNLKPGDLLTIQGSSSDLPKAVTRGIIIVSITVSNIKRDGSYVLSFEAIPYRERVGFRPDLLPKPSIAGTIPATVVNRNTDETYAWLDEYGRYHVKFNFDLDNSWKKGYSSLPVRLAKPYAGGVEGFHFPILAGVEVQIAFIDSDPDRPYIAHVMHNHQKMDHVTQDNHTRNVIRTPSNNKLRMEDRRGSEHIKLNTEHFKTQLNLGHLVDSQRKQRGEGFELRTDSWGAIRAGKGLFITTNLRAGAGSTQLDMIEAKQQLQDALLLTESIREAAEVAKAELADLNAQKKLLNESLDELRQAALLISAPAGIGMTTENSAQLSAGESVSITARKNTDISVLKRITLNAGKAIGLFAREAGMKLFAAKGKIEIQAQRDEMHLVAQKDMTISSYAGKTIIAAKEELLLMCGGAYIRLKDGNIEYGSPKNQTVKAANWVVVGPASLDVTNPEFPESVPKQSLRLQLAGSPLSPLKARAFEPYKLYADGALIDEGLSDETGNIMIDHKITTKKYKVVLKTDEEYELNIVDEDSVKEDDEKLSIGFRDVNPTAWKDKDVLSDRFYNIFQQFFIDKK